MSGWIKVGDKAPPTGSIVLCWWPVKPGFPADFICTHTNGIMGVAAHPRVDFWCNPEDDDDDYAAPSHWQPLPFPPVAEP